MLDSKRLQVFHEVAERGSFSDAALELNYTQSAVSHHIGHLEKELGVTLFERGRRPIRLTPAGQRLQHHTTTILGAMRSAETEMRSLAGMEIGVLRVGAFLTSCNTFVPPAFGAFAQERPGVEVQLEQADPPEALKRLIAGDVDLAIVYEDIEQPDERLERVHLMEDRYRIVLWPGHRLEKKRELSIADLRGERLNVPRRYGAGLPYRQLLEELCRAEGFEPEIAQEVGDINTGRAFIAAGLSIALMPSLAVPPPRADVVVKPVRGITPFRQVYAVHVKGRRVPGLADMIAAMRTAAKRLEAL